MGFDLDSSITVLQSAGYKAVTPAILLRDLAAANNTSAKAILDLLNAKSAKSAGMASETHTTEKVGSAVGEDGLPSGFGRATFSEMSERAGVDVGTAIQQLEEKANVRVTPEMKIREIAEKTGKTPMDIWEMIQTN